MNFFKNVFNYVFLKLFRRFNSRKISVEKSTEFQKQEYYKYEQVGPNGMALLTENFLRWNLLQNFDENSPLIILNTVNEFYRIANSSIYLLIAADICRFFAKKAQGEEQIKFYLSAFRYCYLAFSAEKKQAQKQSRADENYFFLQELQIANEAIAGIFSYLKKKDLLDSSMFTLRGIDGSEFVMEKQTFLLSVQRNAISDFSLCSDYSVNTLRLINRHSGYGVPLVAKVTEPDLSRSLRTPPGLTIPVTFFLRAMQNSDRQLSLFPYYQNTAMNEELFGEDNRFLLGRWMLARDFTTPLACFMNDITQRNLLAGMLHSAKYDSMTGLYMVEPYQPEKIPVVFVHGLMSSPETWGQMINSLKYDPAIRKKYQFWFFAYSTGAPVLYSAGKLRRYLLDAQKEFCTTPEATKNFERMVLVGHSMGGLVVRLLLQKNPYHVIEYWSHQTWEALRKKLTLNDVELLENFAIIHPLPFVKRAVFMAVPHRGAAMAKKQLANLGVKLIRMPESILSKADDYIRIIKTCLPDMKICSIQNNFITGIDNLKPDGVFVKWFNSSSMRENVVIHSIIGNQKEASVPGGSDGLVSYSSSHLDGVASECIVKSPHNVQLNPEAIRELLRILILHLKENDTDDSIE